MSSISPSSDIQVLADTAFGLPNLIDEQCPSAANDSQRHIRALTQQLETLQSDSQRQVLRLTEQRATVHNSHSFKLTAPLRSLRRGLTKLRAH